MTRPELATDAQILARWEDTPYRDPIRQALMSARARLMNVTAQEIMDRDLRSYVDDAHTLMERIWSDYSESELTNQYGEDPAYDPCDAHCSGCNWCSECDAYHNDDADLSPCCGFCSSCDRHDSEYATDNEVCDMGHCHECEHHCESV